MHHVRMEGMVIDTENEALGMRECFTTWESQHLQFVDIECKNAQLGWSGAGDTITFTRMHIHHIGGGVDGGAPPCTIAGAPYPGLCHAFYGQEGSTRPGPIIVEDSLLEDINGFGVHNYVATIVRNNRMRHNNQGGIYVNQAATAYGNLITHSGISGINLFYGSGSQIVGNTIAHMTGVFIPEGDFVVGCGINTNANATVKNNLVLDIHPSGGGPLCEASSDPGLVSNNMCTQTSGSCQVVTPTSTFFVDPSTENWRTHPSSPARDQGITLAAPYDVDLVGVSRTTNAPWDIGAYEFEPGGPPEAAYLSNYDDPPATTIVGTIMTPPLVVGVFAPGGVLVTTSTAPITLSLAKNPAGAR